MPVPHTTHQIAQLVAYRLGTGEVLGSNPGKGENFSMKINIVLKFVQLYKRVYPELITPVVRLKFVRGKVRK